MSFSGIGRWRASCPARESGGRPFIRAVDVYEGMSWQRLRPAKKESSGFVGELLIEAEQARSQHQ